MKIHVAWLLCLPALAEPSAKELLTKVADTYGHMASVHVIAQRSDSIAARGKTGVIDSECELAARGRDHYYVRLKRNGQEAVAVSDGEGTWKALPSKKQWSLLEAASTGGEEEADQTESRDLHGFIAATLFAQYAAVARNGEDPELGHDEDLKVGGAKLPCYVVKVNAGKSRYELWIDRERFVVLQSKVRTDARGVVSETKIKATSFEMNPKLDDAQFQFEAGKGWSQVEMLLLPGENSLLLTGSHAANFSLKTLAGDAVALDQTRGKVVVLDFWATWCPPCRKELPSIEKLRAEFADRVEFYGVNDEESGTVKEFVKKNHYELSTLMDSKRQVHRTYGVTAIPTLLVIDRHGVIRQHFIGGRTEADLRKAIEAVLRSN